MSISRRGFNWIALSTLGGASIADAAVPVRSAGLEYLQTGPYNYRVRYLKGKKNVSFWIYASQNQKYKGDVPVTLVLSSSSDPNTSDTTNLITALRLTAAESNSNTVRYRLGNQRLKLKRGSQVYFRLLLGPEQSASRVWKFSA